MDWLRSLVPAQEAYPSDYPLPTLNFPKNKSRNRRPRHDPFESNGNANYFHFRPSSQISSDETARDRIDGSVSENVLERNGMEPSTINTIQIHGNRVIGNNDLGLGETTPRYWSPYPSRLQMITDEPYPDPVQLSFRDNY